MELDKWLICVSRCDGNHVGKDVAVSVISRYFLGESWAFAGN